MEKELKFRSATVHDIRFLLDLRNDETVRKNSFSTDKITYEEHSAWLHNKLQDSNCSIMIVQYCDAPIGQIRVDRNNGWGEISYALCTQARGKKLAKQMIRQLEQMEEYTDGLIGFVACVKKENEVSRHIFSSLGYDEQENNEYYEFRKKI